MKLDDKISDYFNGHPDNRLINTLVESIMIVTYLRFLRNNHVRYFSGNKYQFLKELGVIIL